MKEVVKGPLSTEATITVAPGIDVVSVISTRSAESLGFAQGRKAYALVKASSVMAVD